jgi:hypothetical protein
VSLNVLLVAPAFVPEPAVTIGTSNSVSWSGVAGSEFYEVQRSTTPSFSDITSSGWIQATAFTFDGLADGVQYFYRARAWRTAASPPTGPWSEMVSSVQNTATGTIGNFIWNDLNGNGIQDLGEPGIPGVAVALSGPGGARSVTTDANGLYQFTNLRAGAYSIAVTAPVGYQLVTNAQGTDPALDSNSNPASVTLPTDTSSDPTIDFGFVNLAPVLDVTAPAEQAIVSQPTAMFQGTSTDGQGIQSVTVNGKTANTTDGFASWSVQIDGLTPGNNALHIVATDQGVPAKTTSITRTIFYASQAADTDHDGLSDAWEWQHGLNLFDDGSTDAANGAMGDPDHDGLVNLLEYALDHDPKTPESSAVASPSIQVNPTDGKRYLVFTYTRRIAPIGIMYRVECSHDLANWDAAPTNYEEVHAPVENPDGQTEVVTLRIKPSIDSAGGARTFVRVSVNMVP